MASNMGIYANLIDDCKKLLGQPPHDTDTNVVKGDGFFLKSLYDKYGETDVRLTLIFLKRGMK